MANPFLYFRNKVQEDDRKRKAPDLLLELIGKTNLDTETMNNLIKSYVQEGETRLPDMMAEGQQGPLAEGQRRETPTNSIRQPGYIYNNKSEMFDRAPEGVSDPIRQIRELGRFRYDSDKPTGNWFKDENGQWRRWTAPDKPRPTRGPTAAQEKERLALERVISQLRQKMKIDPILKSTEPITDKQDAIGVVVGEGLDVNRYPEIQNLLSGYDAPPEPEPEQPGFFDKLMDLGKGTAKAVGAGTAAVARSGKNAIGSMRREQAAPAQADVQEVERKTKDGKVAIFDAKTKQFLRWK